ncbi:hypothetical protein DFH06DRAFT_1326511 [Mycena polygramma]|nr:hypothetical protein DFH06DRAFT_1326511 [Mycena polygramma]
MSENETNNIVDESTVATTRAGENPLQLDTEDEEVDVVVADIPRPNLGETATDFRREALAELDAIHVEIEPVTHKHLLRPIPSRADREAEEAATTRRNYENDLEGGRNIMGDERSEGTPAQAPPEIRSGWILE